MARPRIDPLKRFWRFVSRTEPDDHWMWQGACTRQGAVHTDGPTMWKILTPWFWDGEGYGPARRFIYNRLQDELELPDFDPAAHELWGICELRFDGCVNPRHMVPQPRRKPTGGATTRERRRLAVQRYRHVHGRCAQCDTPIRRQDPQYAFGICVRCAAERPFLYIGTGADAIPWAAVHEC